MISKETIPLGEILVRDFDALSHNVVYVDTLTLRAPTTEDGIILLNTTFADKPRLEKLAVNVWPNAIEITRHDYGGIQAVNAGAEAGPVAPMLRRPAGVIRVDKDDRGSWQLGERRQDILDMYTMNYFLDIVALHALKERSRREDVVPRVGNIAKK